jgi:hypothetical protein
MMRKIDKDNPTFYVSCADWECVLPAQDYDDAASIALERASEKYGKHMNLSPSVGVMNLTKSYEEMDVVDSTYFVYTPTALANAGLHSLSKKYSKVIDLIKNQDGTEDFQQEEQ